MHSWTYVSAFSVCCAFAAARPATAQTYTVTDLGTFSGGTITQAYGIDDAARVTGWSTGALGPGGAIESFAFIYQDGKLKNLGALGGTGSLGYGISDERRDDKDKGEREVQVTGTALTGSGADHAFLYKDNFMRDLGTLPGGTFSQGNAINRAGEIAGEADDSSGIVSGFLYKNGNMMGLPPLPGGNGGLAFGINDRGDVTGTTGTANGQSHAFLYANGRIQDLGGLPGSTYSVGRSINDAGQITGEAGVVDGSTNHGFLYSKGKMTDMGLLPTGQYSTGNGLNGWGDVVGSANVFVTNPPPSEPPGQYVYHAVLYSNGQLRDLNAMIPANSGWVLNTANAINDRGQIVGTGTIAGNVHGFLLTLDCSKKENSNCDHCKH
jgi:probable HAF family extracellular repeat protein